MSQQRNSPEEDDDDLATAWSLASTAQDLVQEYGRRFPNYRYGSQPFARGDDLSVQNERAYYDLILHVQEDKLFTSPIANPRNILDVRCDQQGLWAKNMADLYPEAQVTAFDVFVPDAEGRQNLEFILQSYNDIWILDEITHAHGPLDFIYARSLFAGSQDYPHFYKQCLDHLEPGGYFEQTEIQPGCLCDDDTGNDDSIVKIVTELRPPIERLLNTDYDLASNMKGLIEEAGFVEVEQTTRKIPWSPWKDTQTDPRGHRAGQIFQRWYETGIQSWILGPCVKHLKMKTEEVNNLCEAAILELQENNRHWYSLCVTVTARKAPA